MAEVVAKRLLLAVPMLFGMSIVVFLIIHLVPGDPVLAVLGLHATPELVAQMRSNLGLDEPLPVQYLSWLEGVLHGDFGFDYRGGDSIGSLLASRLPVTLELSAIALVLAVVVAVPLGVLSAVRRGRAADRVTQVGSMLGISVPDFWLGIMLILVFSLGLGMFPSAGWVPLTQDPWENIRHALLPAIALAAGLAGVLVRITRASMLEVLQQHYVLSLRSRGIRESSVVFKHALRNAAIPIVTVIGMQAGYLLGGAIIVEQIFALPGVGRLVIDSVLQRNYPVVQGAVLVIGALFVLVNLVADMLYIVLNPRLRAKATA